MAEEKEMTDQEKNIQSLHEILNQAGIKKAYFIDDQVGVHRDFNNFFGLLETSLSMGKQKRLEHIFEDINFEVPKQRLREQFENRWEKIDPALKKEELSKLFNLLGFDEAEKDLKTVSTLENYFPKGLCKVLSPSDWESQRKDILDEISKNERILVLFDRDLKHAGGEYSTITGEDLIIKLKQDADTNKFVCALLTHTIQDLNNELPEREEIISNREKELSLEDFFPLSKSRLEDQALFSDGIKKTVLNQYCETFKSKSSELIQEAYQEALKEVRNLDTYAFDHIILKSSFIEGLWESKTLFRINDILFKNALKQRLIETNYIEKYNPQFDLAREISKVTFDLNQDEPLYSKQYILRKTELYEAGKLINELHQPIKNGDIFEVVEEDQNEQYILVAQNCDLMLRGNTIPLGQRKVNQATLLKIDLWDNQFKRQNFAKSRFKLPYYHKNNKHALVNFNKAVTVDIDIIDLAIFNKEGNCTIDPLNDCECYPYLSPVWRGRYDLIKESFLEMTKRIEELKAKVEPISSDDQESIIELALPKVAFKKDLGNHQSYTEDGFNFGLKRIKRFRSPGVENLLDSYTKYISREANPHDFAEERYKKYTN